MAYTEADRTRAAGEAAAPRLAVGAVVIGRNEGERLVECLRSLGDRLEAAVYVDSGSDDGSPERAAELGAVVVELDPARRFTAARARNAGLRRLRAERPDLELVQFVDGDCALAGGWLDRAADALRAQPDVAVVCGRRRERWPDASPYNRLADMEWDTPVGDAAACGGDALMRARVVEAVGGYNEGMIAGEDPELCLRVRRAGHRIVRLDSEMTLHDAALARFGQWWTRSVRAGHAFAESAYMHGLGPERYRVRELASALAWGAALPLVALAAWAPSAGLSLLLLAGYPVLGVRILRDRVRRGAPARHAALYAMACIVGKFAAVQGALQFAWNRVLARRPSALIEYK